jgi:hypothetical protein
MPWSELHSRTHHAVDFAEPDLKDRVHLTSATLVLRVLSNATRDSMGTAPVHCLSSTQAAYLTCRRTIESSRRQHLLRPESAIYAKSRTQGAGAVQHRESSAVEVQRAQRRPHHEQAVHRRRVGNHLLQNYSRRRQRKDCLQHHMREAIAFQGQRL